MQTSTSFDGSKFPLTFSTTFVNAGVPGPSSSSRGSSTNTTTTTNSSMAGISKSSNFIRDNIGGSGGGGIINPIFIDPLVQIDEFEQNDCERELETFPTPPPPPNLLPSSSSSTSFNQPKTSTSTTKPETLDRTDSASNLSGSTVITNASSTGGLLSNSIRSSSNNHHHNHHRRSHSQQQFSNGFHIDCPDCQQFHHNHHRIYVQHHNNHKRPVYLPITPITSSSHHHHNHPLSSNIGDGYAPYPPQWYYLLAADTKKFRKHRHTHYRRDCRQCREIVRSTFEQYYLRAGQPSSTMGQISSRYHQQQPQQQRSIDMMMTDENSSPDSIGSISLDYHQQPYSSSSPPTFLASSPTPSSLGFYSRYVLFDH